MDWEVNMGSRLITFVGGVTLTLLAAGFPGGCANPQVEPIASAKTVATVYRIVWVDAATGQELFDSEDIVRYHWDQQVFELTPEKGTWLQAWFRELLQQRLSSRKFIVKDDDGPIYSGRFVSSVSSEGFEEPVIYMDYSVAGVQEGLYKVNSGYPGDCEGVTAHKSMRMKMALMATGKLRQ
jgi:hypothetical protein